MEHTYCGFTIERRPHIRPGGKVTAAWCLIDTPGAPRFPTLAKAKLWVDGRDARAEERKKEMLRLILDPPTDGPRSVNPKPDTSP